MSKWLPGSHQKRQQEIRRLEGEISRLWNLYERDLIDDECLLREQGPLVRQRRELADQERRENYAEYRSHIEAQRAEEDAESLAKTIETILSLSKNQIREYKSKLRREIEKRAPKDKRRRKLRDELYEDLFFEDPYVDQVDKEDIVALYYIHSYLTYKRWHKEHWGGVLEGRDETREFYKKKKKGGTPRRKPESQSIVVEAVGDTYHHKIPGASTGRPTNKLDNDLIVKLYTWCFQKGLSEKEVFDNIKHILDAFCDIKMGKDNLERIIESYSN